MGLHHAMEAVYELQRRLHDPELADAEVEDAIAAVRALDARHLSRVDEVNAAFAETWRPADRPPVAVHRRAVADILQAAAAVAIAGGHIGVLLRCLRMLDVGTALHSQPVIAWSAGAMALADTVVLFHDLAVHSPGHAEVYERGLARCHGILPLPHARQRLRIDDQRRMAVLARRFAPARCLVLEQGTRVDCPDGRCDATGSTGVGHDGTLVTLAS